jgi:hypothetical protein
MRDVHVVSHFRRATPNRLYGEYHGDRSGNRLFQFLVHSAVILSVLTHRRLFMWSRLSASHARSQRVQAAASTYALDEYALDEYARREYLRLVYAIVT